MRVTDIQHKIQYDPSDPARPFGIWYWHNVYQCWWMVDARFTNAEAVYSWMVAFERGI